MPKDIQKNILKKGKCVWRSCNNFLVLRWRDKRDVYMISTKHESVEMVQLDKKLKKLMKPTCILEYNKGMGTIDHQNQMLASFPIMRKVIKGYKLFFYMSDMALFNTYILHKTIHSRKRETYGLQKQFYKMFNYRTTKYVGNLHLPFRLQAQYWAHFSENFDPTPRKKNPTRACKVCYKHKIRSETKWECTKCKVALHLSECVQKYHTMQDY